MEKVKIDLNDYCHKIIDTLKSKNSNNDKFLMLYHLLQEIHDKSFQNGISTSDGIQNELIGKLTTSNQFLQEYKIKTEDSELADFPYYISFDKVFKQLLEDSKNLKKLKKMRTNKEILEEVHLDCVKNNCQSVNNIAIIAMETTLKEQKEEIIEKLYIIYNELCKDASLFLISKLNNLKEYITKLENEL